MVRDKRPHPMTPQVKPPYLRSYVDREFGTTIRRISDAAESAGENAVVKPVYSTVQAWNCDETRLMLWVRAGGRHFLLDGQTYRWAGYLNLESPTDIEQVLWDNKSPHHLYYPSNHNAVPRLMEHDVRTNTSTVFHDFSGIVCPAGDWAKLLTLGSDPLWSSWPDRRVIGLACGEMKFAFDLDTKTVIPGFQAPGSDHAPAPAPSAQRFVLHGKVYGPTLAFERDLPLANPNEHASITRLANGSEHWASVLFDALPGESEAEGIGTLALTNLETGQKRIAVGPARGYPYPPSGTHISALSYKAPGLIAVSVRGDVSGRGLLDQELLLVDANTGVVNRVGHHRTYADEGPWGYWSEAHPVLSPSGTRIIFASDWHGGETVDTYVVELPGFNPCG